MLIIVFLPMLVTLDGMVMEDIIVGPPFILNICTPITVIPLVKTTCESDE